MPDCYMIAISIGIAVDQATNNLTLFSIVEGMQAAEYPISTSLVLTAVWKFDPSEYDVEYEARMVSRDLMKNEDSPSYSRVFPVKSNTRRLRINSTGLEVKDPGYKQISLQYREKGAEEWLDTTAYTLLQADVIESVSSEREGAAN